jgi:hypothetical protein
MVKLGSNESGYDIGDVGNALIDSLSNGNIPLAVESVFDEEITPSFSSKPLKKVSLPAHLRPPSINTSPRDISDCNDDKIIAMLHHLKNSPTPTSVQSNVSKDSNENTHFSGTIPRENDFSPDSKDPSPYNNDNECNSVDYSSAKRGNKRNLTETIEGQSLSSNSNEDNKSDFKVPFSASSDSKRVKGPGRPKGSFKNKHMLTLDTKTVDFYFGTREGSQSPTSRALRLLYSSLQQKNSSSSTQNSFVLTEDEPVPLQILPYFKYLSETSQRSLMRQLIEKFQRTTITPRNASLFTPRFPSAGN